ncbi:hypothetical protein GZ212_03110 [Mangrovimonas sp. CR14]|uniref:hypothetical protein n=1 Tax=Mangrovimonas sp. CR14 TaxID=2706120 RepID=UPI0014248136|nr:hypothetical protein [Mangrovimonas sp. CR14]NIK91130.1 hypothetical protein [Mangrovimonas sp. CR14]
MKNFICSFAGHEFRVTKEVTTHVKEFKCIHCKKEMTTGENGHLRPLTDKYREINSILNDVHKKKKAKKRRCLTA